MTKKERKKFKVLSLFATIPIVSTDQVSQFFLEHGSPHKRASECLKELEKEKWIEGRAREIGKSKIWRLTKIGREKFQITRRPVPFTAQSINHYLAIGDVYLSLLKSEKVIRFECELRKENKRSKYCPDAFFTTKKGSFFVEVQRSALSRTKWKDKWQVAKNYFYDQEIEPIIALSNQNKEIVRHGSDGLKVFVSSSMEELISKDVV